MPADAKIHCYKVPEWVKWEALTLGGYKCEELTSIDNHVDILLIGETEYLENTGKWHDIVGKNVVGVLIIYSHHAFFFTNEVLEQLDSLPFANRVRIITNGHWEDPGRYKNIVSGHFDGYQHWMSHYVIYQLAFLLEQKRKPNKDFIWYMVPKDSYRRQLISAFKGSELLENSIVSFEQSNDSLRAKSKNFLDGLDLEYENSDYKNAFVSFGSGLPDMKAYEQCFCEVVTETANNGAFHITEKFYRPTAFGIPVVMLCGKPMYSYLIQEGYELYNHDNFYDKFHGTNDMDTKLQELRKFLTHIKEHPAEMQKTANRNRDHFWQNGNHNFYKNQNAIWKKMVGKENVLEKIYKELNF